MIIINKCTISSDASELFIDVTTGNCGTFDSIKVVDEDTYKRDGSPYYAKLRRVDNEEVFVITAKEMGITSFNGIYFVEILANDPEEEDCDECSNKTMVVVSNLVNFYKCALHHILSANKNCAAPFSDKACDSIQANRAVSVNVLIEAVIAAIKLKRFTSALRLMDDLRKLCDGCSTKGNQMIDIDQSLSTEVVIFNL